MAFIDHQFPSHLPSYVHHADVLKYLQNYASHHNINQFIKFGTIVEKVKPIPHFRSSADREGVNGVKEFKDTVKWRVSSRDVKSGEETTEDYDLVLVCNG